jgi:hypothetical protein
MKIKILKDTVGLFRCSYGSGDLADLPSELAKAMIDAGYAEADEAQVETAKSKAQPEKAVKDFKKK